MPLWLWGLVLDGTGLFGSWLLARLNKVGWVVSLIAQALWLIYSIQTKQWGFFPGITLQTIINIKGFKNWKAHEQPEMDGETVVQAAPHPVSHS